MLKKNLNKKNKLHVNTGDNVKIISGKDKGRIGEVIEIISKKSKIIVKNINLITKHSKPKKEGEIGQILKKKHLYTALKLLFTILKINISI